MIDIENKRPDYLSLYNVRLSQVRDDKSFFKWLNNTLIPNLYAQNWYNNKMEDTKIYINDKRSILLGMPRMKQNRVGKG